MECMSRVNVFLRALPLLLVSAASAQADFGPNQNGGLNDAIARSVRAFELQGSGSVVSRQPGLGYSSELSPQGALTLRSGTDEIGVRISAFGRGTTRATLGSASASLGKDTAGWPMASFSRTGLSEWFVNGGDGLHHWMKISNRPGAAIASGSLWVRLAVSGATKLKSISDDAVEVRGTRSSLTYAGLKVWDARGVQLPARLEVSGQNIAVAVDDSAAVYPVTIDPTWFQQQKLTANDGDSGDAMGVSVDLDGDVAVVGAYQNDSARGAAYIFRRTGSTWTQTQKLVAADGVADDNFGIAVAIDGPTIIVGAPLDDSSQGAAYVFRESAGTFSQSQKILASDGISGDEFGNAVDLDGTTAIIGASVENAIQGSAYVFVDGGASFTEQQKLVAADGAAGDNFGVRVAVSGDSAIVGAFGDADNQGSAYVFTRSSAVWTQQQKLTASDGETQDNFGWSVDIEGDTALVGAYGDDSNFGAAYVFTRSGSSWTQSQKLIPSDAPALICFGFSVALDGTKALIGAIADLSFRGASYVFNSSAGVYSQAQKITPVDAAASKRFGGFVSLSGDYALVGATGDTSFTGAAYAFKFGDAINLTLPSTVKGGAKATLSVTLTSAAPVGGTTVSLATNNAAFPVPASIVVPEGATSASVQVTSLNVAADTLTTVTATSAGFDTDTAQILVKTARMNSVTFASPTVNAGGTVVGTITLNTFAPAGGATVSLSSSNPAITVPSTVLVPGGQNRATFNATAGSVSSSTSVNIIAVLIDTFKTGTVTVVPAVDVSSVSVAASPIRAGGNTTGTVTLVGPAGTGGQIVQLTSSSSQVTVPATVTVPQGVSTMIFPVTSVGTSNLTATITARVTTSKTTTVSVNRPVLVSVALSPTSVQGGTSSTLTVTLAAPAPAGGVVINLTSQKTGVATVPVSVTIPAGSTSTTATVTTFTRTTTATSWIYANIPGDGTRGALLTVTAS